MPFFWLLDRGQPWGPSRRDLSLFTAANSPEYCSLPWASLLLSWSPPFRLIVAPFVQLSFSSLWRIVFRSTARFGAGYTAVCQALFCVCCVFSGAHLLASVLRVFRKMCEVEGKVAGVQELNLPSITPRKLSLSFGAKATCTQNKGVCLPSLELTWTQYTGLCMRGCIDSKYELLTLWRCYSRSPSCMME